MTIAVEHGDCVEVMREMAEGSVDAIVTDPPYGLEFMGKEWDKLDGGLPQEAAWKGRRGQGGGRITASAATAGSRHRVTLGARKPKFKRCTLCGKRAFSGSPCVCPAPQWAVEYPDGATTSVLRMQRWHEQWAREAYRVLRPGGSVLAFGGTRTYHRLACAIEDAGFVIFDCVMWLYGTGYPKSRDHLKPAYEPICLAYKPGGRRTLQVDECRIEGGSENARANKQGDIRPGYEGGWKDADRPWPKTRAEPVGSRLYTHKLDGDTRTKTVKTNDPPPGRWPANVCHDGSEEVIAAFPDDAGARSDIAGTEPSEPFGGPVYGRRMGRIPSRAREDTGSAARFFYSPKADAVDRWGSRHPTVKPIGLMKWLVPLVTAPGGLVLDPFAGSGTTGVAALATGRNALLIEREAEYIADIRERLAHYAGEGMHSLAAKARHAIPRGTAPLFDTEGKFDG